MVNDNRIAALILAAGYSSRMGAFKPLLPIGNMTALEQVSSALKTAGIKDIICVTGYQRELLRSFMAAEGITEAHNSDFAQGMFTSIQAGIRKVLEGPEAVPEGFFLMLVDCPLVPAGVMKQILERHQENPDAFIVPCFRGKKGHPLFIPGQYAEEILAYEGEGGLKAITNRHEDKLIRIEVETETVVLDMDTPEGYEEILSFYNRQIGTSDYGYESELEGKRLFLIRHGEIRQHKEKIFLGQADIPLSEKGVSQARKASEELKRYGVSVKRIYASDLSRALDTAEIIREGLEGAGAEGDGAGAAAEKKRRNIMIVPVSRLREMSLGEWDGRYIREIREQYPDEYRKRGENLLTYKFGNESENFYDLQYRVMKGLKSILKEEREAEDSSRDIVIVSHSGVINTILSELQHRELSEQIGNHIPNGGVILQDNSIAKEKNL